MKQLLLTLIAWTTGVPFVARRGRSGTCDSTAIQFRMQAGFPGDVNRTHPASIEPTLIDSAGGTPPTAYGQAVLVDTVNNAVRPYGAGDAGKDTPYGVTVRPFPTQQASATNFGEASLGAATPPTAGIIDVLRSGYIMVQVPPTDPAATKGGAVFVRIAAAAAGDPVGGFKTQADGGNTVALDVKKYQFNGPGDALGNTELSFNV